MSPSQPNSGSTRMAGVVVTYFPDADFADRLAAVAEETAPAIVVDNSSDPVVQAHLRTVCAPLRVRLIENPENRGIGGALNRAFADLEREGIEWAVAFDQDSMPELGFAAALLETATAGGQPPAAITGANWHDRARPDSPTRHLRRNPRLPVGFVRSVADHDLREITCVITSGSLFHLPTWRKLGGFDANLFLDLVDTEYCLRARAAGCDVRVAARARLRHQRGAKRPVRFAGRTWWPAFMPESRLTLLFRNRLFLFRRHGPQFPHWVAFELAYAAKILAEIVFLEDRKLSKLQACLRGTWAGMVSRSARSTPLP